MRGNHNWMHRERWGIYARRFFSIVLLAMFVFGLLGWIDGWGDSVTQEVTQVIQEEAGVFSSPALIQGTVETLAHKWFDFHRGSQVWTDTHIRGSMQSQAKGDVTSEVISVALDSIKVSDDPNTGEVSAIMHRKITMYQEDNQPEVQYRTDQLKVALTYKDGRLEPLSGPVVSKSNRVYGVEPSNEVVELTPTEMSLVENLAKSYASALSSGSREQIGYLFQDQSVAPDPLSGSVTLQQAIPTMKNVDEVILLLRIQQEEETGILLSQIHQLECVRVGDRYLIKNLWVGEQQ